jgi:glycosyltransferase involved in cell wall biosynthesis
MNRHAHSIVHFQRKPFPGQFSIENLFANLRATMGELGHDVVAAEVPYTSKGIWRRLANMVWAARRQGAVNHVTGDIHFLAIGLRGHSTILTIHDCHGLERLRGVRRWLFKLLWFDLPLRRAAAVTVISHETKRQLMRHLKAPPEKIEVIPDAVSPVFRPSPKEFNADCPQILHIGTMPNKNLPRLIQAIQGLNCRLKVVGILDDSLRAELQRSGIAFDCEANLGEADMYRAYREADLLCYASTYEGFGMPIIEAEWVERPVITSNCSSMPEVAGAGACLVDPFDVASIRAGLLRVMSDASYRNRLIEAGRKNRERYSLREVASQYLALYRRVAASEALDCRRTVTAAEA